MKIRILENYGKTMLYIDDELVSSRYDYCDPRLIDDLFLKLNNAKRFCFRDDVPSFTNYKWENLVDFLMNKYEYKEEEKEEIQNFIN